LNKKHISYNLFYVLATKKAVVCIHSWHMRCSDAAIILQKTVPYKTIT